VTYLVPFDGSELSVGALAKARIHAIALDEAPPDVRKHVLREKPLDVVVVSVVPNSARYAREKGWIDDGEEFRVRDVVERLHEQVTDFDPSAEFTFERVDGYAPPGAISSRIKRVAEDVDPDMVFIGSENAGRIVTPITSVAADVSSDRDYDVCIVRHRLPPEVKTRLKSEFYIPE
jgi:nucleotide-binding universal stress UspA family protein